MKLNFVGVPVYLNGQNYFIPSLAFADFKANYEMLTTAPPENDNEKLMAFFEERIPVIGLAVRRNYPDITDAQLTEWLDMNTMPMVLQAVAAASGMKPVPEGE